MKKPTILLFTFLMVASILISACSNTAVEEPVVEQVDALDGKEPIKVGFITDATGPIAIYGEHLIRSVMLGFEYATGAPGSVGEVYDFSEAKKNTFTLDGREIIVYVGDDKTNPDLTASIAKEFIEVYDVDILMGSLASGNTAILQEIAAENEIVMIAPIAGYNSITGKSFTPTTFSSIHNMYQQAVSLCKYLTTEYDTFIQIAPDSLWGWESAESYRDACTAYGGEFVAVDTFAPLSTTDFTAYMEDIMEYDADTLLVSWAGGGFVPLMQAAEDIGLTEKMDQGSVFIDNLTLPVFFGNFIGMTSVTPYHWSVPDNAVNDWLIKETKARYGIPPDLFDPNGMTAALMLVEALKATNGDASADALIPALEGMEIEGPKGMVYIRPEDHVLIQDMYIVKLLNVDDPNFDFFELVSVERPEPPCLLVGEYADRCGDLPVGTLSGE